MDRMAARTPPLVITPPQGLMRAVRQPQTRMALKRSGRRTTRTPVPMPRPIKPPTPTEAMEAQSSPRTATPPTPSIRPQRMGRLHRHRLRQEGQPSPRPASMAIVAPRHKPQMGTSTRRQMAMSTRTPGAVGIKPRELRNPPQATPQPLNPPQATQVRRQATLRLLAAMEGRKRAAGRRPLAAAGAEVAGNRGRRALVVRRAAAVRKSQGCRGRSQL